MNKWLTQKIRNSERYSQYGRCCWSCTNDQCWLFRNPPHESGEGRVCIRYTGAVYANPAEHIEERTQASMLFGRGDDDE
jgi:hypothetical protein